MSSRWRRVLGQALWLGVLVSALVHASGLFPVHVVSRLDLVLADFRLNALMPRTLDERVVIVDVDEKSLAELGRWPWSRNYIAAMVDELFERQKVAVVGFDMVFAEPDPANDLKALAQWAHQKPELAKHLSSWVTEFDHDAQLARALTHRPVVLGYYFTSDRDGRRVGDLPPVAFDAASLNGHAIPLTSWNGYASNLKLLAQAAPQAGYFNASADIDGLVRSVPLLSQFEQHHYESLALAVFRRYTGSPLIKPVVPTAYRGFLHRHSALSSVNLEQGGVHQPIPVDGHGRARVPYRGPGGPEGGSFAYVSASDLLKGRIPAEALRNKLILVGSTAPGLYDQRATPVSEVFPGVEVHANLLSGLLDARLAAQPDWARGFEIVLLCLNAIVLAVVLNKWSTISSALFVVLWVCALAAHNLWAYARYQFELPLALTLLLTLVLYAGHTIWNYIMEGRSRRSLTRLFGSYVPPELVAEMAKDPARYTMRAENRELTVMFCDMRNFTQISENLPPEEVRALVNQFFSNMTAVIGTHRGTLDKYIGDALMAFWGAPVCNHQHAADAVKSALGMLQRLNALNSELVASGLPRVGLGVGLNTGLMCVGDMGSSLRRSYTVMGDPVNLASRIEALTRHYGVDILAGESTFSATAHASNKGFEWVEVDRVRVKGKEQPVTLFTPVSSIWSGQSTFKEEVRLWSLVLTSYRLQDWSRARNAVKDLQGAFCKSPLLGLYQKMEERIAHCCHNPPVLDWDGASTFNTK